MNECRLVFFFNLPYPPPSPPPPPPTRQTHDRFLSTFPDLFPADLPRFVLLFFVASDFCLGSAIFATFNLLVSDVIDDDMRKNKRPAPLSSSVFGTNALITKPAMSLAPMLVKTQCLT